MFVEAHVYACKKKTMGDCVSLLFACVLWDQVCEFARAGSMWIPLPETLSERCV